METAQFVVTLLTLASFGIGFVCIWEDLCNIREQVLAILGTMQRQLEDIEAMIQVPTITARDLGLAHPVKSKESAFDKPDSGNIPMNTRYVPVSRRRAAAEAASQGPETHTEQVRANNAKVMERL